MLALTCHPQSRASAVRSIHAAARRGPDGALALEYVLEGDLGRVRVPPSGVPRITERLWQHTCCEAFVRRDGSPAYHEFNLSPSGEWAAYAFERYREGRLLSEPLLDPHVSVHATDEKLTLAAVIRIPLLSTQHASAKLAIALSVVVEEEGGQLSYWALNHPAGKPDFHHAEAFALELA